MTDHDGRQDATDRPADGPMSASPPVAGSAGDERIRQFLDALEACDAEAVREWVGRRYDASTDAALLEQSGAAILRPVRPGEAISMDFRSDRLTIELDADDTITTLRCG